MTDGDFFDGSHLTTAGITRLFISQLDQGAPLAATVSRPYITDITNPNGLEAHVQGVRLNHTLLAWEEN